MGGYCPAVCDVLRFKYLYNFWSQSRCTSNFRILPPNSTQEVQDWHPQCYLPSADWWLFPRSAQRLALIFRIKHLRCFCDVGSSSFYVYVLCVCVLCSCVFSCACVHMFVGTRAFVYVGLKVTLGIISASIASHLAWQSPAAASRVLGTQVAALLAWLSCEFWGSPL